ncbi:MAG: hypothetical protein UZ14_CFX002002053 [Chloroflexi bacterium OLB14]|nr:MAG: hypothetical protein UZ14_CFX002002053 [Chloroflexi bacterium OLB14]
MPKISLIIFTIILISCSPQVTVTPTATIPPPTSTPIPTPTLHPDFVAVQNQLAELNENLTLLPDGTIEEQTADGGRQTIPNLHVDQNGVINIIFNNEHVVIDKSQISFDDEGLKIEGYELDDNGEWVEVVLTPEQMVMEIFEEYGVDTEKFNPETVTITPAEDGEGYTVTYNETGKVIIESDGEVTKFEIGFATDEIARNSCEPTSYEPLSNKGYTTNEVGDLLRIHAEDVLSGFESYNEAGIYFFILIKREGACWAFVNWFDIDSIMYYRDSGSVGKEIRLIDLTAEDVVRFQLSRKN